VADRGPCAHNQEISMQLLSLTLPTPAENVALDEALLDEAQAGAAEAGEVLRLWEAPRPFVVIGRSSRIAEEVNLAAASAWTVIRRCSGGAAVVAGPGCLMYAVVLSYERRIASFCRNWPLRCGRNFPTCNWPAPVIWPGTIKKSRATACAASAATCCTTARCCTTSVSN
jgi:hypothetical protein